MLIKADLNNAKAITRGTDGDFVIAGARDVAWAAAVSARGEILWKFEQPQDARIKRTHQSQYLGVVPLLNDGYLLCGEVQSPEGQLGLLTILDRNGKVLEERRVVAQGDQMFWSSSFYQCISWGQGFLAIGVANDATHAYAWLMRLDKKGAKEWETVNVDLAGSFAVASPTDDLLMATMAGRSRFGEGTLYRVGSKAEILFQRSVRTNGFTLLRSTRPRSLGSIILDEGGRLMVHTLNARLEDMEAPKTIPRINTEEATSLGCGYVLPDNSLALFGFIEKGGGALYTAAVAHVGGARNDTIQTFASLYPSVAVTDAVRISESEFVTVRNAVSEKPMENGVVLSWITL